MFFLTNLFDEAISSKDSASFGKRILEIVSQFLPFFNQMVYPVVAVSLFTGLVIVFTKHENRRLRRNAVVFCIIGLPIVLLGLRFLLGILCTYFLL